MKAVLVTGGTGFIGRHLIPVLQGQAYECHILSRQKQNDVQSLFSEPVTAWQSLQDIPAAQGYQFVINLAGAPIADKRWTDRRKESLRTSRISLTKSLVEWMVNRKVMPEAFISGSAIGYYGNMEDTPCTEESSAHDEFTHQLCKEWESEALVAASHGIRTCVLRTGIVLGRHGGILAKLTPVFKMGLGGPLGSGNQWMSWVHMEDIVACIHFLMKNTTIYGPVNATSPHPVTNREFTRCLGKALGRPAILPVPAFLLKLMLGEMSVMLTGGQRVFPEKLQAMGFSFRYPTIDEAFENLFRSRGAPE